MTKEERTRYLLHEFQAARHTLEHSEYQNHPDVMSIFTVGVLRATLEGLAGLGEFAHHASCFDPAVTQEIRLLVETLSSLRPPVSGSGEKA